MKPGSQWRSIWLPGRVYRGRERLSSRVAACVLIAPELRPSRDQLPRAEIWDSRLAAIMRLADRSVNRHRVMAALVYRELGKREAINLLSWVNAPPGSSQWTSLWQLPLYVRELRELQRLINDHEVALKAMADTTQAAAMAAISNE